MASSDDDEDLKRAIAMSLGDAPPPNPVINLDDSDDEDEDLRRALALSLEDSERATATTTAPDEATESLTSSSSNGYASTPRLKADASAQQHSASTTTEHQSSSQHHQIKPISTQTTTSNPLSGLLGLDRKAMEQERLARLGKRKRDASPEQPSKMPMKPPAPASITSEGDSGSHTSTTSGIQYPKGSVKRTWAYKHPRTNDITIEEVFQSPKPNIAVLSIFQLDDKWLFSKLNPETETKQITIWGAKNKTRREQILSDIQNCDVPNFKACFPPMDGDISNMHSKLMLLFHDTHLRIVIPTANLTKFDWGETNTNGVSWQPGVLENTVFLIDLPRRPDGGAGRRQDLTSFGKELYDFVEIQGLGENVTGGLMKFDFSQTGHVAFVHSVPGKYASKFPDRTGVYGLARAISDLGLNGVEDLELDYAASSLGALTEEFLTSLYNAARGSRAPPKANVLDHVRVYFPTAETVASSTGGPACAGIITLGTGFYDKEAFPRQCMRDYKSTRPGMLSHNKLLLARGRKCDGTPVAWAYVGSANLSEAAWGRKRVQPSPKPGKPNLRNWESGVVVPVPKEALDGLQLAKGEVPPMEVFRDTLEIPFEYPAEPYNGKRPWLFKQHGGF